MIKLEVGSCFAGRYEIVRCIGSGGMGVVYLGRDSRYDNFQVALKVLYPYALNTPRIRERFRTEIIASYRISHRNIVRAYEFFDENDVQAYAMEFVDGADLQVRMKRGDLTQVEVVSILQQAAAGLEAIHREGILHRDLKPENILLTCKGLVKIADFGVARLRDDLNSITTDGLMVGTPKYISPEYIETGEADHRGDIYALGVIGYEMIAGEAPFRSQTGVSLMLERFRTQPKSLRQVAPECPPQLAQIIAKAMNFKVSKRYELAAHMRADLEAFQRGEPLPYVGKETPNDEDNCTFDKSFSVERQAVHASHAEAVSICWTPPALIRYVNTVAAVVSLVVVVLCAGVVGWYAHRSNHAPTLQLDSAGRYEGRVNMEEQQGEEMALVLQQEGQLQMTLADQGCARLPISDILLYRCGSTELRLEIQQSDHRPAGVITFIDTGTKLTWSARLVPGS